MPDVLKPAMHGRDNRDGATDPISGEWFLVLNEGDTPPDDDVEDEDFVFLQNGWAQPAEPLQLFSFRRGLSKLDTRGHLDSAGASSGTVAVTIPEPYRLPLDQFFTTVVYDGSDPIAGMVYIEASSGDTTITFPLT